MNISPEVSPAIHPWQLFDWSANSFKGRRSDVVFTGEPFDGEFEGMAIEGKSGKVIWFFVSAVITDLQGNITSWVMAPLRSADLPAGFTGTLYNK